MKEKILGIFTSLVMILGFVMTGDVTSCHAAETTNLTCGQKISDSLEKSDDVNYYTYNIDKSGYFALNFTRGDPTCNPGRGWNMALYDASGNLLSEYNEIRAEFTTPKLNFKQGTKIYVKISPNCTADAPTDQIYCLMVYAAADANREVETMKNASDSWESRISDALELTASKWCGSLWKSSDEDIYKLSVPKTGMVTLNFYPNISGNNVGWGYDVAIYKKSGDEAIVFKQIKSSATKLFYVKEGTYYVVVKASWTNDAPSPYDDYVVSAKWKAASAQAMKIRRISYAARTTILKWKKVRNVDGYEIQLCPNRKFKKGKTTVYTTVETSYRFGGKVSKGTYYVRVRPYADTLTGNRLYGKFTKVKKIKKK